MGLFSNILREVTEKSLVYHRSNHPMKVGDIISPKIDKETKKHWMETLESEIGLELYRREEFPDKLSRFKCIYSSIIPRSRFVYKGNLYIVRPKGKIHIGDSGIVDELIHNFNERIEGESGNFVWARRVREEIKEDPKKALNYLNYRLADKYWKGDSQRGNFRTQKKNIEVLSESAEVIEVIQDTENDIKVGNKYEVTESDKLLAWLQPSMYGEKITEQLIAFNNKVIDHLFSSLDKQKTMSEYEKIGYLKKGIRISPREVRLTSTKSQDAIMHPSSDTSQGKYSRISMGFEFDGKWYMPYKDDYYKFDLTMAEYMRHYHKQPFDFGKYLRKI